MAFSMSEMDVDAEEPLLNLPVALTPIQQHGSLVTASLITEDDRSGDEHNEATRQLFLLRILGRPYAAKASFWTRAWPLSLIQGAILGLLSGGFIILVQVLLDHWFVAPALRSRGELWWVIITSVGGFLCGLILLFPGGPRYGSIRTTFNDISDLKGCAIETPFVVAASLIAMATGAPLGPELAVSAMGSCVAAVLASCLKVDRRTEAGLVQAGLAGSLGGLLLSPILGVTLMHELSVTGRRSDFVLDTLTCSELGVPRDVTAHRDHDFMEQVTLGGTAATGAYVVSRLLLSHSSSDWGQVMDLGEDVFENWHLVAAVPIGLVCGVTGMLAIGLIWIFQSIRVFWCRILEEKLKFPPWIGIVLVPTVGGFVHGLFSVWNPALAGNGMRVVFDLVRDDATAIPWLVTSAVGKLVAMAVCIGFGLVGGPIFPMMFVGLCLGMALTPLLPISLTVPSCMCATVASFVPIPFTLVFYIAFSLSLSVNQIGPVFVATIVAFTFVGGLGIIKRLGERRLGYVAPEVDQSQWEQAPQGPGGDDEDIFQYEAINEDLDDDDEEFAQEVHNAVFGDTNPMW